MRIGFCVAQLLLNQLKHLAGALRIHMRLQGNPHSFPQLEQKSERNKTFNACRHVQPVQSVLGELAHGAYHVKALGQFAVIFIPHHLEKVQMSETNNWQRVNRMISLVTYAFI